MKDFFPSLIFLCCLACTTSTSTESKEATGSDAVSPVETAVPAQDVQGEEDQIQENAPLVYVTDDGDKYHTADCRYSKTAHEVKLSQAKAEGKTACGVCKPNSSTGEKQIRCSANTTDGSRCKRMTTDTSGKCFQHQDS